uniref:Death domain-containing protein n=1 Tax=Terrapene triunguis TaxID=2587831 RepID=A0A674JRS9_9SAUR
MSAQPGSQEIPPTPPPLPRPGRELPTRQTSLLSCCTRLLAPPGQEIRASLANGGFFLFQASACPSGTVEKPPESQGLLHLQVTEASQMNGNACSVRPLGSQDTWESPAEPRDTASKPRTAERCLVPRHMQPPWLLANIPASRPRHGAGTGTSDSWQLITGSPSASPSLQAALRLADALFRCPAGPLPGVLPQGSKLYDIINTVPVRRWKEFMRVLELHDGEIEVVELEFAHVRDQQYEMLKRWYQQKNATLESIFSALERMELAGCAEELRQRLQRCP